MQAQPRGTLALPHATLQALRVRQVLVGLVVVSACKFASRLVCSKPPHAFSRHANTTNQSKVRAPFALQHKVVTSKPLLWHIHLI